MNQNVLPTLSFYKRKQINLSRNISTLAPLFLKRSLSHLMIKLSKEK